MAADGSVVGLCQLKINGLYHVDAKNFRWSVKRPDPQFVTGAGIKMALGVAMCSGSFEEVIPRKGAIKWASLKFFSVELLDDENKTTLIKFEGCNWGDDSGSTDRASAVASRTISFTGTKSVAF